MLANPRARRALPTFALTLAGGIAGLAGAAPAAAQLACGKYDELRSYLADTFNEQPSSFGLNDDGTVLQLFASPGTGTWTMLTVSPAGTACVVATGRAWQDQAIETAGRELPS
ncbi:hypothetical protein SH611_13990 [Geminicoccaceae bacterium 1502E]|nr:hypothetical protein [Geminicoccaceae bacterium 1502E]